MNGTDLSNLCLAQRRKDAKEVRFAIAYFSDIPAYVLANKTDKESFYILADRLKENSQNSPWYPYPNSKETISIMERAIQEKINNQDNE